MSGINVYIWIQSHEPDGIERGVGQFGVWQIPLFNNLKPEDMNNNNFQAFEVKVG